VWRSLLVTFAVLAVVARWAQADDELPNAVPTVMYKPWSVAFALGPAVLRARTSPTENHVVMYGDMAVRYRVAPPLEIGVALGGGLSHGAGYGGFFADIRYRALAEGVWNPFALASLIAANITGGDSFRLGLRGGLGIERRFQSWAFIVDTQLAWIVGDTEVVVHGDNTELGHYGAWSVSTSIGAVYYFGFGANRSRRRVP
jgi:hypothetical protein